MAKKYKSPFTEELYLEWEQIAVPRPGTTEKERLKRWHVLYNKYFEDGETGLRQADACLITSLGSGLYWCEGKIKKAKQLAQSFLALPGAKEDDVNYAVHVNILIRCLIVEEKFPEALSLASSLCKPERCRFMLAADLRDFYYYFRDIQIDVKETRIFTSKVLTLLGNSDLAAKIDRTKSKNGLRNLLRNMPLPHAN